VALKRAGWKEFAPALLGTTVRSGDLLQVDAAAKAAVYCADRRLENLASGTNPVPCRATRESATRESGSRVAATRSDTATDIPIVLAPRMTKILAERPLIKWAPVAGATAYRVSVTSTGGPKVDWTTEVIGAQQVQYPADAPPLSPDGVYKITVVAGSKNSDADSTPGLGFAPLKLDQAQAVRAEEQKIAGLGLAEEESKFLVATLYAGHGSGAPAEALNAEAMQILEELAPSSTQPAVFRMLGDLHRRVGLNRLGERHYQRAAELSKMLNDVEGEAQARDALGLIYEALGNSREAAQHSQAALALYEGLGDAERAKEISGRLEKLPKS
jgi:hypothetical protein